MKNLNEIKQVRYLQTTDITNEKTYPSKIVTFPFIISKTREFIKSGVTVYEITLEVNIDDTQVRYNISFLDTDMGWCYHKDFLKMTELLSKISQENYDIIHLEGLMLEADLYVSEEYKSKTEKYLKINVDTFKPYKEQKQN